jgi:hypothetical protein
MIALYDPKPSASRGKEYPTQGPGTDAIVNVRKVTISAMTL